MLRSIIFALINGSFSMRAIIRFGSMDLRRLIISGNGISKDTKKPKPVEFGLVGCDVARYLSAGG